MKLRTLALLLLVLVSTLFPGIETRKIKSGNTEPKKSLTEPNSQHKEPKKSLTEPNSQHKELKVGKSQHEESKVEEIQPKKEVKPRKPKFKKILKIKVAEDDDDREKARQLENTMTDEDFLATKGIKIIGNIGSGNFGSVLKVEDSEEKIMAVKKVILGKHMKAEEEKKILEAVKGARHITELKGFWKQENIEYYKFDLYEGSLDSYPYLKNKKGKLLDWRKTFKQILEGLADIHDAGVMHLDIKPANIMIKGEDVFIGDFGISKKIDSDKKTSQGSAHYKAPEQGVGSPEAKSDIWAVGNLLLWFCTGKTLNSILAEKNKSTDLIFVLQAVIKDPTQSNDILSEMLDEIKLKLEQGNEINVKKTDFTLISELLKEMMTVDPTHRASAKDLLKKLE